jgi:hypothetical protein
MRASCSDQAGLGVPRSPSPITSTPFDRRVVRLQLLSSAIGKRVLDVAQRNSTLGRDARVLGPDKLYPGLRLPAFASASRRPSANVESYKFLTSTPLTRRGGQSRAPRAPARIRDDRGHRNSRRHRDRHRREPLRWFGHRPVQGWREIVRTRQPGPKCTSFPEEARAPDWPIRLRHDAPKRPGDLPDDVPAPRHRRGRRFRAGLRASCRARCDTRAAACACRKLNSGILVMQSAENWATKNVPSAIDGARDRCIFLQG